LAIWAALAVVALAAAKRAGWFRASSYRGTRESAGVEWLGWLGLAFGAFLAQVLGAAALAGVAMGPGGGASDLTASSLATIGGALGVGAAAVIAVAARPALRRAGLRARERDLWVGTLVFAGAIPLVTLAATFGATAAAAMGAAPDPLGHETLRLLRDGAPAGVVALTVVAVTVAAPVAEEILYRGFLQTAMVRAGMGALGGVIVTSGLFVVVHAPVLDAAMMPALFVLSVILGLSYERTGRLGTPIVAHALFNAFNLWASGV